MTRLLVAGVGLAGIMVPGGTMAQTAQPDSVPASIVSAVRSAVAGQWAVDPQDVILEWGRVPVSLGSDSARVTMRAASRGGWFVVSIQPIRGAAVAARVRAGMSAPVMYATRPLSRGQTLAAADLEIGEAFVWGGPAADGTLARPGWQVRSPVAMGDALIPPVVSAPPDVTSGEDVELIWTRGDVSIVIDGVALFTANIGQAVRVRLPNGRGVVRGRVVAPGRVRLEPDGRIQ